MALPDVDDVKAYLGIEHADEDAVLEQLLAQALALVEAYLRRPITAAAGTQYDVPVRRVDGRDVLFVDVYPIAAATEQTPLTVTDADDETVDAATYRLDAFRGTLTAKSGESFSNGPYTVVAHAGLSARADYATGVEPLISAAIIDVVADRYQRRNPAASTETDGDVSTSYRDPGIPERALAMLAPYRRPLV